MKITYIHHSAFLAELEHVYLLFDYTEGELPALKSEKPLFVFASHRHGDHYSPVIFDRIKEHERTRYVLSNDIWRKRLPQTLLASVDSMKHGERAEYRLVDGSVRKMPEILGEEASGNGEEASKIIITTYKSTDEGVAFLIETEGKALYHAGDLNNWRWDGEPENWNASMAKKYSAQIDKMAGTCVDAAFLPLDPRQEEYFYLGMDEYLRKVDAKHVFPMHCWGDFSVIGRLKAMACSEGYRDRIIDITRDGESWNI